MYGKLFLLWVCSTFCGSEGVLKTIYTQQLCYSAPNPLIRLRYDTTGILTSLSSDVFDNCKIILLPKPSWSVVLSIYQYNLNENEQLIIEVSDGHKLSLIGRGYFPDERKSIVSDGGITIHYKKNSTFDPSNHVKFQFTYTQVHSAPCWKDEFECRNGKCLPRDLVCDRHNHCGDRSDVDICDLPHSYDEMSQQDAAGPTTKRVNASVAIIVSSVVLALIVLIIAAVVIHRMKRRKRENSKTVLPEVAPSVPSNSAASSAPSISPAAAIPSNAPPTNDLQPKQSIFARLRNFFRSTTTPKVERGQNKNEHDSESYEVPAIYPQIPSAPCLPGSENPDFHPDE